MLEQLQADNVIVITKLGSAENPSVPSPDVPAARISFNDLLIDPDGVLRRNLMFAVQKYDLHLMSLKRTDALPKAGESLVIIAKIEDFYHARIFDRTGNKVLDKGNGEFSPDDRLGSAIGGRA